MKIGVIGAPGVGKTTFANALGKELGLPVVDRYAQKIQKDTGLALGPWASYSENFMVAGARLAAEEKVGAERITVGTALDTVNYAALKSDITMRQTVEHKRAAFASANSAMMGIGCMIAETWDYNLCFIVPIEQSVKTTLPKEQEWTRIVADSLPIVAKSFQVATDIVFIDPTKTLKENIETAKSLINAAS